MQIDSGFDIDVGNVGGWKGHEQPRFLEAIHVKLKSVAHRAFYLHTSLGRGHATVNVRAISRNG